MSASDSQDGGKMNYVIYIHVVAFSPYLENVTEIVNRHSYAIVTHLQHNIIIFFILEVGKYVVNLHFCTSCMATTRSFKREL